MKCLELLDMINLWEVGVDGAARNFSRIRRELAYVISGLQQLEELFVAHNKDSPSEEERDLLAALKNSAEKAMNISQKAASACFQKTKAADNDIFQSTRGYSFTESSTRPAVCHMVNSSHSQSVLMQTVDVKTHAKDPVILKRPFSTADSYKDSHSSCIVEDGLEDHLLTINSSEDHFKKVESNKTVNSKSDYTDDPPEHKPEHWQPKENVELDPYCTYVNSADEIRNRRSKFLDSLSVDQAVKTKSHNEDKKWSHSQGTEKPEPTERHQLSVSPAFSDESDSDLQLERVMSKISSLEEERLNLMETIEILQSDNVSIRQSLRETLGTLEMKDVQLKLAMQDLGVATSEIKKASELNGRLRTLERYLMKTIIICVYYC